MSTVKFAMNVDRFKRALLLTDKTTRENVSAAIQRGTRVVTQGAVARAPSASGELRSTIRDEYSKDGLTGFVKAGYGKLQRRSKSKSAKRRARLQARRRAAEQAKSSKQALRELNLGVYAPVIERGDPRRNRAPQPFLNPSLRAERPGIQRDVTRAMETGLNQGMSIS